jgi:hypothetical protein
LEIGARQTKNHTVRNFTGPHLDHNPLSSCAMRVRMAAVDQPRCQSSEHGTRHISLSIDQSQWPGADAGGSFWKNISE